MDSIVVLSRLSSGRYNNHARFSSVQDIQFYCQSSFNYIFLFDRNAAQIFIAIGLDFYCRCVSFVEWEIRDTTITHASPLFRIFNSTVNLPLIIYLSFRPKRRTDFYRLGRTSIAVLSRSSSGRYEIQQSRTLRLLCSARIFKSTVNLPLIISFFSTETPHRFLSIGQDFCCC